MATSKVKGMSELHRFLDGFAPKMRNNVVRRGARAGVNVALPVARGNIRSISGKLAKGLKVGTRVQGTTVRAYIKATGEHAPLAHLVEHGTKPHFIAAKKGGALSFGGVIVRGVEHPGARPKPFGRPALDQSATRMAVACGNRIAEILRTKYGLDAHDVEEGDE